MFTIVPHGFRCVVTRFGKISGVLDEGIHLYAPFFDQFVHVNWRFSFCDHGSKVKGYLIPTKVMVFDPDGVECTTKDNLNVDIDIVCEFRIVDVPKAATCVQGDLFALFETQVLNYLYRIVREMDLVDVKPAQVTAKLYDNLNECRFEEKYGIVVESATVDSISLPAEIVDATVEIEKNRRMGLAEIERISQERAAETAQAKSRLARMKAEQVEESEKRKYEAKKRKEMEQTEAEVSAIKWKKIKQEETEKRDIERKKIDLKLETETHEAEMDKQRMVDMLTAIKKSGLSDEVLVSLGSAMRQMHASETHLKAVQAAAKGGKSMFIPLESAQNARVHMRDD